MSSESINPINSNQSYITTAMNSSVSASSWLGRKISPHTVTVLTVVALAALLPTASAYGFSSNTFYADLGCDYDFYGYLIRCCHLEEVCRSIWHGIATCQLEEVCTY